MAVKAATRAPAKAPARTRRKAKALSVEEERFAVMLNDAIGRVATDVDLSEGDVRTKVARLVEAGLLQEQKAPGVWARRWGPRSLTWTRCRAPRWNRPGGCPGSRRRCCARGRSPRPPWPRLVV